MTSNKDYHIMLFNTNSEREYLSDDDIDADNDRTSIGTQTDELDTNDLEGTYMLTLNPKDEGRQAVYPVVVQAFDFHLEYPSTATQGETVEISATIDSSDTSMVESVEVALWDGSADDATNITLNNQDDGTYSETLDLDDYDEGEYEIYGAAFGDDEAEGYPAPIAIEDGETMTVSADDSHEDDKDSDDSEKDTDEESESGTPENETDGEDSELDMPGNETDSEDSESDMPGNETDTEDETESGLADNSSEETEEHGDDEGGESETGVISPNDEDDDGTGDQDDDDAVGTPGAVFLTVFLLLGLLVFGSHVREGSQ
ncbi:hypothetical protein [Natronorubrum sp. A-ect3]|uniref:hypothetical protein n=1 Tax=Natronorubrum sp. A-ect3 TaxID=3242698 RepID=UPI00359DAA29